MAIRLLDYNLELVEKIAEELLDSEGNLRLLHYSDYGKYSDNDLAVFCHLYARYLLPTIELIDFIKDEIGTKKTIEIGAGSGDLGRSLNIKMTDNYQQERPEVKAYYESVGQPTIKYGSDVEKLDAISAINKYKPDVVIGAWVTHKYNPSKHELGGNAYGIDEEQILKLVDTYIVIGAEEIHNKKPILDLPHEVIDASEFVRSRRKDNLIYIWNKDNGI